MNLANPTIQWTRPLPLRVETAFTLLEMLLAVAIASIVMVAI